MRQRNWLASNPLLDHKKQALWSPRPDDPDVRNIHAFAKDERTDLWLEHRQLAGPSSLVFRTGVTSCPVPANLVAYVPHHNRTEFPGERHQNEAHTGPHACGGGSKVCEAAGRTPLWIARTDFFALEIFKSANATRRGWGRVQSLAIAALYRWPRRIFVLAELR